MQLIRKGDKRAFTEVYNRYATQLLRLLSRMLGDTGSAEDVLHDVFLRLIEQPDKYDTKKPFKPWIYSVAMNRCRNVIRNAKNRKRINEEQIKPMTQTVNGSTAINKIAYNEFSKAYSILYKQCSSEQQELLTLRFQQELSIKEIAVIMDTPEGTIKSRLFYLIRKFYKPLQAYNPLS